MSNQSTPLPLEHLFAQLQAAGFRMDTRRKLRMWRALHDRGAAYVGRMDDLKYLLAPLAATNGAEQERFYKLWEGFLEECKEEQLITSTPEIKKEPIRGSVWMEWAWIVGLLALGMAYLWWKTTYEGPKTYHSLSYDRSDLSDDVVREGDTVLLKNTTTGDGLDTLRWEIIDVKSGQIESADTGQVLTWIAKDYGRDKRVVLRASEWNGVASEIIHIHCPNPPKIDTILWPETPLTQNKKYRFAVKAERGALIRWVFDDKDTLAGASVDYTFKEDGQPKVTCLVARQGQEADCYEKLEKTLSVGSDKPFLQLAELHYDEPRILRQLAPWVWLLLLLPLLAVAWLFRHWWKKRHAQPAEKTAEELAAQYPIHDSGPYFIPYRPQNHKIGALAAFFRMAEVLSRREEDERRAFDPQASIQATIDGGGFPSWRERAQTSPPDYLFLVTRRTEQDQQGRLFERLTSFLKSQDAPISVFFHDGQFRHFWNPEHPAGVSLNHLAQQYADHQLVLLGDGHGLFNPYDTRRPAFNAEAAQLLRWRKRLLLTPSPVAAWSYQEALLHQHFLLYPADTDGLLAGIEALEGLEEFSPDPFLLWEAAQGRTRSDQSDRYRAWDSAATHRDFLKNDPDTFRWLCALAVTTQPDYALSIALGHALGIGVTHDRLLRLSRIPWLSANEPANALRLELLAQLSPDDERRARQAAADELEAMRGQVAGAFAETDWKVNLAIHRFAIDPRDEAHKQAIRELRQLGLLSGGQLAELDWIVQQRADGRGLPTGAKKSLDAWLDAPAKKSFWTWEVWVAAAVVGLTGILYQAAWRYNDRQQEQPVNQAAALQFWQVEKKVDDEALRLHNLAVGIGKRLAALEKYSAWQMRGDSIRLADSLFKRAFSLRGGGNYDPISGLTQKKIDNRAAYSLAISNWQSFYYNNSVQRLNFFLADSAGTEELQKVVSAVTLRRHSALFLEPPPPIEPLAVSQLATLHCHGLCHFYLSKAGDTSHLSQAVGYYAALLKVTDSTYFDSLRATMPVNLQTLLAAEGQIEKPKYALRVVVLEAGSRKAVAGALLQARNFPTLRTNRRGLATYSFKGNPPPSISLSVSAPDFALWQGSILPRTDGRTDTIFLSNTPSPSEPGQRVETDRDGDTIPDAQDKCPEQPGPKENNGCPIEQSVVDSDGDGIADTEDQCPTEPGSIQNAGCPTGSIQGYIDKYKNIAITEMRRGGIPASILLAQGITKTAAGQSKLAREANNHFGIRCGEDWQGQTIEATLVDGSQTGTSCFRKYNDPAESFYDHTEFFRDPRKANRYGFLFQLPPRDYEAWARGLQSAGYSNSDSYADRLISLIRQYKLDQFDVPDIPLPTMIPIAGGTLTLGCTDEQGKDCGDDEKPPHDVTLSDFSLSATEVTNEQYAAFLNDYGSTTVKRGDDQGQIMVAEHKWGIKFPDQKGLGLYEPQRGFEKYPVVNVTWYGANEYCRWLSDKTGKSYRLPTEAEWEYAARGGQKADPKHLFLYAGSDDVDEVAWYFNNSNNETHPVGQKKANALGLYDMSGNVWEWCADWYGEKYYRTIAKDAKNPVGPKDGDFRVVRGGSWYNLNVICRVAYRNRNVPNYRIYYYGFRLAGR